MYKRIAKLLVGGILLLMIYGSGYYAGFNATPSFYKVRGVSHKEQGAAKDADFTIFWDAWRAIEEKFAGRENLDTQKMVYGAVEGMVNSLGDPYTAFFPPARSQLLESDINGTFSGIGAEIGFKKETLTIIAPLKNSPAERGGLLAGDKIIKINDSFTADMTLEEAVSKIRGEKGTSVTLAIFRESFSEAKDFVVVRDIISIPVLEWKKKGEGVVHLKLFSFTGDIDAQFRRAARILIAGGAKKIILDMRNNPGGFLDSAVQVASYFLPKGELVASEDFGNGLKNEFRSKGYPYFQKMPVVVLIDGGSASASEIVAGALKDGRNAVLVGEKTFGKGSVQEVVDLTEETIIKITVAKWLTPSGRSIQDQGIEPEIKVEITAKDKEEGKDPQLDKALEIIKNL